MNTTAPSRSFALPDNGRQSDGGGDFSLLARSLMLGRGSISKALEEAEAGPGMSGRPASILRAAVSAGTTTNPAWAGSLIDYRIVEGSFVQSLGMAGLFDRMLGGGMVRLPSGSRVITNTVAITGNAVGESLPKPITSMSLTAGNLPLTKVACVVVLSEDVLRLSPAGGTAFLSSELRKGVVSATDTAFLAGITTGLTPIAGSADAIANIKAGLGAIGASASSRYYLGVSPATYMRLGLMTGSDGHLLFDMTAGIGSVTPVASDAIADNRAILADASRIAGSSEPIVLDSSNQASLLMDSAPSPGVAAPTSLWQDDLRAIRAERYFAFRAVGTAVAVIQPITWGV